MSQLFEIGDVIRKLRLTKKKMDIIPFSQLAGVNKATVSHIENGGNFEKDSLDKIAMALGYTTEELYGFLARANKTVSRSEEQRNIDLPQPARFVKVPYYERIPAGDPQQLIFEQSFWIDVLHSSAKPGWYALRVSGDSMLPEYRDGDIILMDHDQAPKNGDTVAALIDGSEATLKVFSQEGDQVVLTPLNHKKFKVRKYHASQVTIQGVLVELVRRAPKKKR